MTEGVNHYHLHANARQQSNQKVVKQEETIGGESDETDAAAALQLLSGTKSGKSQLPQMYGQRSNFTALGRINPRATDVIQASTMRQGAGKVPRLCPMNGCWKLRPVILKNDIHM